MKSIEVVISPDETRAEARAYLLRTPGGRVITVAVFLGGAVILYAAFCYLMPSTPGLISHAFLFLKCFLVSSVFCSLVYIHVNSPTLFAQLAMSRLLTTFVACGNCRARNNSRTHLQRLLVRKPSDYFRCANYTSSKFALCKH